VDIVITGMVTYYKIIGIQELLK